MTLTNLKVLAYLGIAASLFLSGWWVNGWRWEAKYANQVEAARKTEQSLQETMDADTVKLLGEMQRIIDRRDAFIDGLRQRPERMPESSRANCKGSTGAELSGRDSEFLIRQAARADEQREALKACYAAYDKIKAEINGD